MATAPAITFAAKPAGVLCTDTSIAMVLFALREYKVAVLDVRCVWRAAKPAAVLYAGAHAAVADVVSRTATPAVAHAVLCAVVTLAIVKERVVVAARGRTRLLGAPR